jgi:predicted dehydrogenase
MMGGRAETSLGAVASCVDAVLVCTPPAARIEVATAAALAGAHLFVEAPLGTTVADASALVATAERMQRLVMTASALRFHPALERMRGILEAHTIGRVYAASMWIGAGVDEGQTRGGGGGARGGIRRGVMLASVPWLDAFRWLFGKSVDVIATRTSLHPDEPEREDLTAAVVRLEGGALAQVYTDALRGRETTRVEVLGTEGRIRWSAATSALMLERWGGLERVEHIPVDGGALEEAEMRHFLACVLTGRTPISDGIEGRATLALTLAVQRAARLRRALPLGEAGRWTTATRRRLPATLHLVRAT